MDSVAAVMEKYGKGAQNTARLFITCLCASQKRVGLQLVAGLTYKIRC
jgi:hypothetical protein